MEKCPVCKRNTYHFYDGALGYEAMRCSSCGFETCATSVQEFNNDVKIFKFRKGIR